MDTCYSKNVDLNSVLSLIGSVKPRNLIKVKLKMKIVIKDYPCDCEFKTNVTLPKFEYGCKVRTELVQKHLKTVKYSAPHAPEDFRVEKVEVIPDGEEWHLGS